MNASTRTSACLVVALMLSSSGAGAQESKPLIVGPGTATCAKFSSMNTSEVAGVTTWAQGFLSGMNSYRWLNTRYQPLVLPEASAIAEHLKTFCVQQPNDTVLKGTLALFKDLEDR